MLYISTRNSVDSFTAYRAAREEYTPDGGMFVPMRFPVLSEDEIMELRSGSFGSAVAKVLRLFFSTELSGWDIDSCAGRHPYKLVHMNRKMLICELWHNQNANYDYLVTRIYHKILAEQGSTASATPWARIAIGIAVFCGIWSEVSAGQEDPVDVALSMNDPAIAMAAYYAKKMGLPIGNILFTGEDDGAIWDLLSHGQVTSECSKSFPVIEQLIFDKFGHKETCSLLHAIDKKRSYRLTEQDAASLPEGLYASVIGSDRLDALVTSIYRSSGYIADRGAALSFGGLQNYRAQTGSSKTTLLLATESPARSDMKIASLLGITQEELAEKVKNT